MRYLAYAGSCFRHGIGYVKKKITQDLQAEIGIEINRIIAATWQAAAASSTGADFASLECQLRDDVHGIGQTILEKLLSAVLANRPPQSHVCSKGHQCQARGLREKTFVSVLGAVTIKRPYFYDPICNVGFSPADKELGIEGTAFSPGVRRMMARIGALRPFGQGYEDLRELAGLHIDQKEIERWSKIIGKKTEQFINNRSPEKSLKEIPHLYVLYDGTGIPMLKKETTGRTGKQEDGAARTREMKFGCVFTQTTVDQEGRPIRDEGTTTYVGAIENVAEFSTRIYREAMIRGLERAKILVVIGDGAPWIWNIAYDQFPGAIQIVDLYHAREHLWNVARTIFDNDKQQMNIWAKKCIAELDQGRVEKVLTNIDALNATNDKCKDLLGREYAYFEKNKERMRYDKFRQQGLFVGSGVVEAGCKSVIGQRMKQPGMHWSVTGANAIAALRCSLSGQIWSSFWDQCLAA